MSYRAVLPLLALSLAIGCAAKQANPETGAQAEQQSAGSRDRNLITEQELSPANMKAQSLMATIRTLRPHFLNVRGLQSYKNCQPSTGSSNVCQADPDEGAVHVSVDNGRILPVQELENIHTVTVKEVRYLNQAQAMQKFGGAARSGPVILVTLLK